MNIKARALLGFMLVTCLSAAVLFGAAGTFDIPAFWAYLATLAGLSLVAVAVSDAGLLQERMRPAPGGRDHSLRVLALPLLASHFVIAGLDARYGWSDVPGGVQVGALLLMAVSFSTVIWAQRVNRFFSPVVRLQTERGHHLIETGPYRFVRHPGYAAMIVWMLSSALALGSWRALPPAMVAVAFIFRRLAIEDRFLREQLAGYTDYARRGPWRLVPGLW